MKTRLFKFAVILLSLIPSICSSEIVKIGFTGEVYYVGDNGNLLGNNVQIGSSISGFYIYDSETEDSNPDIYNADYYYSSSSFGLSLTVGSILFQTDKDNVNFHIEITNNSVGQPIDTYSVVSRNNLFYDTDIYIESIGLKLDDLSGHAISDTQLLSIPPNLSLWQYKEILIYGGRGGTPPKYDDIFSIGGHITSFYIIPEPATLFLLGLGCLLIRKMK